MKIYTVIPYYSDCEGMEVFLNDVKSFTTFEKAEEYAYTFSSNNYDIVESELEIKKERKSTSNSWESGHKRFVDEWGNSDWRDTGEMGG
jgi:hypothetical protein